jgi:lysophospholipase L1-like esterase
MGFACVACAQTNAIPASVPVPPVMNGTVTALPPGPIPTTTPDNTRYINDPSLLASCQTRLDAFNDKPCDIIFIGANNIADWSKAGKDVWDKTYAPRHALNFGLEGDTIQNVLWRLNNMNIQNLKPKVAVIMLGANNVADGAHAIADGVKAALANTQEAFPGVKIILVSLLPNEKTNATLMQANSIIKNYADDSTIYFLDLIPFMPPVTTTGADGKTDTNWKGISGDHLRPDASGYQIWADGMEPLLTKLLAGG